MIPGGELVTWQDVCRAWEAVGYVVVLDAWASGFRAYLLLGKQLRFGGEGASKAAAMVDVTRKGWEQLTGAQRQVWQEAVRTRPAAPLNGKRPALVVGRA